jgi:hypothetical protein
MGRSGLLFSDTYEHGAKSLDFRVRPFLRQGKQAGRVP